jgi:hypothetical protein
VCACVHMGECMLVCMRVYGCNVFRKNRTITNIRENKTHYFLQKTQKTHHINFISQCIFHGQYDASIGRSNKRRPL